MESACCSSKSHPVIINITTMGYLGQNSGATVWGVIKLLKLAVISKKDIYEKPQTQQQQAISLLKKLSKAL